MKTRRLYIIVVIGVTIIGMIFLIIILPSVEPQITISTDKKFYDNYLEIEVSGLANPMVEGSSLFSTSTQAGLPLF